MIMIPIFSNMTVGAANVEITVSTLTGKTIPITIDNTETVLALKTRIQEREGVPPDQQRLIFAGKQLEEDKTLESYNIQTGATIHIVLRQSTSTASIRKGVGAISGYNTESNTYNYIYYGTWRNAPIKWRVLDTKTNTGETGALFLMTDECMGSMKNGYIQFNPTDQADRALWKGSDVQTWCTNFYSTAFTTEERTLIPAITQASSVYLYRAPADPSYFPPMRFQICGLEAEYVFVPSIQDIVNADYGFIDSKSRIAEPFDSVGYGSRYWLRSFEISEKIPFYIGEHSDLTGDYGDQVAAVRPVMNLSTAGGNILFTSAAVGGKPDGGLTPISEYSGNEWKLTLRDSSRSGFSVESTSVSTTNYGGDIKIKYSGAKTGANEYISVMLMDSAGNPTYYGRSSASLTSESGTAKIPVATGLTAGDYTLYVFNEQYNGDKMTDYASELKSVAMTVREANTYTVTYAPGANGTGTAFTTNKIEGINLVLSSKTFSRTDYKQIGWSKVDGGEKDYDLGAIYTADEPITLYPVWERQYGLTISGKDVTSSNQDDVFGDGKVKFEYDYYRYKYILTLTDVSLDDDGFAVIDYSGSDTIEIVLVGKNELNSSGFAGGIISSGRLIFSGEGSLKLSVTDEYANAIDCKGIIVNGGDITIEAAYTAIYTDGEVSVNDGSLTLVTTGDGSIIDGATGSVVNVAPGVVIKAGVKADGTDAAPINASETDKIRSAKYLKIYKVPHIHCICGGHGYDGHDAHTDIEWEPWGEADSLPTSGYYYLTCNIELPYDEGVFDSAHICLNGYSIRGMKRDDGALSPFTPWLATHGEFVITDCGNGSIGDFTLSGGKMIMYGGSIPEGTTLAIVRRGEFYAESGAEINGKIINSGKISGGTFNGEVLNEQGTISGGTFNGKVTNKGGTINDGTFTGTVDNVLFPYYENGYVSGSNPAHINGGIFTETSTVNNVGCIIENGTFRGKVTVTGYYDGPDGFQRPGDIEGGTFTETSEVTVAIQGGTSGGRVGGGNFSGTVRLEGGEITDYPIFTESSKIYLSSGYVKSGIFYGTVTYGEAVIYDSACRTATFVTDGGSAIESQRILRGQKMKKPENPTKPGYTFSGWSGGENEFDFDAPALNDVTATAKWSINKYKITIKPGNGEDDIVITQDFGTALTAPTLTKTGYTFIGWDVDFPATMPAESMTITAKWKINQYTIKFETDGGTFIFNITADYGSKIHNPGTLYKPGFIFEGWDRPYLETMPAENITLTAQWSVCNHSRSNQKASCKDAVKCSVCKGFIGIAEHTPVRRIQIRRLVSLARMYRLRGKA